MSKRSFEDIDGTDELCEHCHCTEYGLSMDAPRVTQMSMGCEGMYCKDAYKHYLESDDDDDEEEE